MKIIIPLWKHAPFVRLLIPLIIGILAQYFFHVSELMLYFGIVISIAALAIFYSLRLSQRYSNTLFQGLLISVLIIFIGAWLFQNADVRNNPGWFGINYNKGDFIIATVSDEPVKKERSWKAELTIEQLIGNNVCKEVNGKLLVYFAPDSSVPHYGDKIIFNKSLQEIKNSGNPGAFDYKNFMAFKGVFHQLYLKPGEYISLADKNIDHLKLFLLKSKAAILACLRQNIKGATESGIAEALLIGYKEDLDKDLVKAYSNTGGVHIIAISGLHLGLIYVLLVWICARIPLLKKSRSVRVLIILSCLWLFSLLTGASASVLRSAVMFSCILAGETLRKKASTYNSLAVSAFLLLCYDPCMLWDAGFQLSYLALIGIVAFQKPIVSTLYFKQWLFRKIWQLSAVSIAAQVLTFPVCIYYFHQFPNIFIITNLITVPLSSVILFAEILLLAISWIPVVSAAIGKLISFLIWVMNEFVTAMRTVPFATWQNIFISFHEMILLYLIVVFMHIFLRYKLKPSFLIGLFCITIISIIQFHRQYTQSDAGRLIVYNIPKTKAIDFVDAGTHAFNGDSSVINSSLEELHIVPARIISGAVAKAKQPAPSGPFILFRSKRILILDSAVTFATVKSRIPLDMVIISHNPKIKIQNLSAVFDSKCYVFDASNSLWKIANWKKECDALHLRSFAVPDSGAFVLDL